MLRSDQDIVVGVDPSLTNIGLFLMTDEGECLRVLNSKPALKQWRALSKEDRNSPHGQIVRLEVLRQWIYNVVYRELLSDFTGSIHVGYEDYSFDSINRPFSLGELGGVLKTSLLQLYGENITFTMVPPKSCKKFAIGRGDCEDKEPIMEAAKQESPDLAELKKNLCTSDVCDAYFLAKVAWYKQCPDKVVKYETHKDKLRARLALAKEL